MLAAAPPSSSAWPSTAAASAPSKTSTPRSAPSSTAVATAATLPLDQDLHPNRQEAKRSTASEAGHQRV